MTQPSPLSGVRVLEVGNYLATPFAGTQLADLGAEVVKIESPGGGDQVRASGPFLDGVSSPFARLNRNKKSLVLDLKTAGGKRIFRTLAGTVDIILENLRPGVMDQLGLSWPELEKLNPGLIYVAASGWGQDGPLAHLPGLDVMAQARSGLMSITGPRGGDPVKIGVPICDLVCALYGALASLAALAERARTGRGQRIDVSLFEAGVSLAVWEAGKHFAGAAIPGADGSAHQALAPYQAIRGSDGWFTVGATTRRTWPAFCRALGLPELIEDPRFREANSRYQHRDELIELIEQVTVTRPKQHWLEILDEANVPCAPIQNYQQVFADPQLLTREFFWDAPHSSLGTLRHLGSPMRFSRTPTQRERSGPLLGEHSESVLRASGFDEREIAAFVEQGVIGTTESPVPGIERSA